MSHFILTFLPETFQFDLFIRHISVWPFYKTPSQSVVAVVLTSLWRKHYSLRRRLPFYRTHFSWTFLPGIFILLRRQKQHNGMLRTNILIVNPIYFYNCSEAKNYIFLTFNINAMQWNEYDFTDAMLVICATDLHIFKLNFTST